MKYALAILVIFSSLYSGIITQESESDEETGPQIPDVINLRPLFDRLMGLVDMKALLEIVNSCDMNSKVSEFIQGEEFAAIHNHFWTEPEFLEVYKFIAENGYPEIYDMQNSIYEFLGLPFRIDKNGPTDPAESKPFPLSGRDKPECHLPTIVDEMKIVVPIEKFESIVNDAVENDGSVRALLKRMFKPAKLKAVKKFMELPEVQGVIAYLKSRDTRLEEVGSEVLQ